MKLYFLFVGILSFTFCFSQTVELFNTNSKASLRGLSVVSNKVIWASGSQGTVLRSIDAGVTWEQKKVPGYEKTDFRDIEAFDKKNAVIMGIDTPAVILITKDGGETWQRTYYNNKAGMFLDAMEFWNLNSGIVIGDPIDGRFTILRTFDGGKKWQEIPFNNRPVADSGEACFASSGTNIAKISNDEAVFVSGGLASNLFVRDKKIKLPLVQGKESTGANAIATKSKKYFIIVGGDFTKANDSTGNCFITTDAGQTFIRPTTPPAGYRSGVTYAGKKVWYTCGLSGVDISKDDGVNFENISTTSFHAAKKARKGKAVFFSGGGGRIGRLVEPVKAK